MSIEQTLSIIKPDGVKRNLVGEILKRFENGGLCIVATRMEHLAKHEAEEFYEVHRGRPFFEELTLFMSSGPVVVTVLEGENAISRNREIMGATNPEEAEEGTIRKSFALSIEANSVHGSDSAETAIDEIKFFFKDSEIFSEY